MSVKVENGRAVTVSVAGLPDRPGHAVPRRDRLLIAYFGQLREVKRGGGLIDATVTIDGRRHVLFDAEQSDPKNGGLKGTVVLTVGPIEQEGE